MRGAEFGGGARLCELNGLLEAGEGGMLTV